MPFGGVEQTRFRTGLFHVDEVEIKRTIRVGRRRREISDVRAEFAGELVFCALESVSTGRR